MISQSALKEKLSKLKALDTGFRTFGAGYHRYRLNPRLMPAELQAFEAQHGIRLPADYRGFLEEIGSGISGPSFGLFPLQDWNFGLEPQEPHYLSTPFPHQAAWNLPLPPETGRAADDAAALERRSEQYFGQEHTTGSIRICDAGEGKHFLLVVTGPEAGHIWVDDRANGHGIYPLPGEHEDRVSFTEWYDQWLTESIAGLSG